MPIAPQARDHKRTIMVTFALGKRPHLRRVLEGINAYARQRGNWELFLPYFYPTMDHVELEPYHGPIDALIAGVPGDDYLAQLEALHLPTVLVDYSPQPAWASTVVIDYGGVATLAIGHFTEQGIRNIASVGSLNHLKHDHRELMKSLKTAAGKADLDIHHFNDGPQIRTHGFTVQHQLADLAAWLQSLPKPCGVICGDDEYAGRVSMAAFRAGLQVGQEILLLGCGDEQLFCESQSPPLSSIGLGYRALGWAAACKIDQLLEDPNLRHVTSHIHEAQIRVRRSSRRAGKTGTLVARAVSHIWQNIGTITGVDAIARYLGVSRTTLGRHFNEALGHGPLQEIHAARTAYACELLTDSQLPLSEISQRSGFADQAHMCRQLRKATGRSPGQWRQDSRLACTVDL